MLYNDLCLNQEKTAWVLDSYQRSRLWLANRCICVAVQKEEVAEEPQSLFVIRTEYKRSVQLVSKIRPLLIVYIHILYYLDVRQPNIYSSSSAKTY